MPNMIWPHWRQPRLPDAPNSAKSNIQGYQYVAKYIESQHISTPDYAKWWCSGTTSPMFDAVMVRREAVRHTPQDSLGPTADFDLAVDRADVRLHGVRAEICQRRDVGIALALR
jgi:hypothetical protein